MRLLVNTILINALVAGVVICSRFSREISNQDLIDNAVLRANLYHMPYHNGINQFIIGASVGLIAAVGLRGIKSSVGRIIVFGVFSVASLTISEVIHRKYKIPVAEARMVGLLKHISGRIACERFLIAAESTWTSAVGQGDHFVYNADSTPELAGVWPGHHPRIRAHPRGEERLLTIDFGGVTDQWGILVMSKAAGEPYFSEKRIVKKWCDRVFFFFEIPPFDNNISPEYRLEFEAVRRKIESL